MREFRTNQISSSCALLSIAFGAATIVLAGCAGGGSGGAGGASGAGTTSGSSTGGTTAPRGTPKTVCAHYLECLKVVDPAEAAAALAQYGDSGSCWDSSASDQDICATFCANEIATHHDEWGSAPACAVCSDDTHCSGADAIRCRDPGTDKARCVGCLSDADCTQAGTTCAYGGCGPKECSDHAVSDPLKTLVCSATCDPVFCDAPGSFDGIGFDEFYAWSTGCHEQYAVLVNCQLHAAGDTGCSPLDACKDKYDAVGACEDASNLDICPGTSF